MSCPVVAALVGLALFCLGFLLGCAVMLRQAWTTLPKDEP